MNNTPSHGNLLNELQQQAVESEALRLLVLAGAGSGKTKTLLQKIVHLIEQKGAKPSEILAITFTKNAANEMQDRLLISADETQEYEKIINNRNFDAKQKNQLRYQYIKKFKWISSLQVRTFHSLCYSILRNAGGRDFDNKFKIIGETAADKVEDEELARYTAPQTAFDLMHSTLIQLCEQNDYLLQLKKYVLDYLVDRIHIQKKDTPLKQYDIKPYTSLGGEKVRSKSEQYIADWLYRHSIRYQYEPLVETKKFSFRPDFFIPDANLYLEHVSNISYKTANKEQEFHDGGMMYIKTFENMASDTALFNHALDRIIKTRLPESYTLERVLVYKEEFQRYQTEVRDFIVQAMRVADMIKTDDRDMELVAQTAAADQHDRIRSFYQLALPLIQAYQQQCINLSYLDFNEMIIRTLSLFRNHEDVRNRYREQWKYILVDEFQDVNSLQVQLVHELLTEQTQLFCVGDDWQSIYGFRGSDVRHILEFEQKFPGATVIKLNLNYRSTQHIVGASNEVISHNKYKIDKEITASKISEQKIVVYAGNDQTDNIRFCMQTVQELQEQGMGSDDILFLYRRSKMYSNSQHTAESYYHQFRQNGIKVQAKTIHAAKGLEAKVVFILGLTDGSGGFPDVWLEDRVFQVIKPTRHDLLLEEERRLFYVAITRAREQLFLITEKGNESSFLKEIPVTFTVKTGSILSPLVEAIPLCPNCNSQQEKMWKYCPYCGAGNEG